MLLIKKTDAKTLLYKRLSNNKSNEDDTIAFIETLEHLPLAITQAAAYISIRKRMTIAKYMIYAQQNEKILLKNMGDLQKNHSIPNSVLPTWQISFDQIKKSSPRATELLSLISVLNRQRIPLFFFFW